MPVSRYESVEIDRDPLRQPLTFAFSKRTAKNRLLKAAMEERLGSWDEYVPKNRGLVTKPLIEVHRRWGEERAGWGIIVTGNIVTDYYHVAGSADATITPESPFSGERFEGFKAMATAGKAHGSLFIGQVNHPGRQVRDIYVKEPISASDVQMPAALGNWTFGKPRAATQGDITRVIDGFAHAAEYLEKAGFDGINLHAAHGYLLAQFLSPRTNKRTDAYGGSLTNRMRLIVEIVQEIRRRVSSSFIVSAKLNSTDWQEDGFKPEDAKELVRVLQDDMELDFVELSGGTYENFGFEWTKESTKLREAFFLEFADMIVPVLGKERKTKVFITGGLRFVGAIVKALDVVDGVGLARPAAQEPRLAADILEGRVDAAIRPIPPLGDSTLGLLVAGTQIRQVAHGMEPFDASDGQAVKLFFEMAKKMGEADKDEAEAVGFPDWPGESKPYGTV